MSFSLILISVFNIFFRMVENSPVVVSWRNSKPPERIRSHSRTFRNPPQPHMCIQDFLEVIFIFFGSFVY